MPDPFHTDPLTEIPAVPPASQAHLFIGGSHDGEWIEVPADATIANIEFKQSNARSLWDQFFGNSEEGFEQYRRHFLKGERLTFHVFTPVRMGTDEMLAWLQSGYGRADAA